MFDNIIKVSHDDFKGAQGDSLYLDMANIRKEFPYSGIWFARDRNSESVITMEFYYSAGDKRPADPNEVLKENSFQQSNRFRVPPGHDHVWVAARVSDAGYGLLRLMEFRKESVYLNCKIVKNRAGGVEVMHSGVMRGGTAYFARLGIEDMMGAVDFEDTTLYLVLIKDPPPPDWGADPYLGVEGVPVLVPPCRFAADGKYSSWNRQNPLDGMSEK